MEQLAELLRKEGSKLESKTSDTKKQLKVKMQRGASPVRTEKETKGAKLSLPTEWGQTLSTQQGSENEHSRQHEGDVKLVHTPMPEEDISCCLKMKKQTHDDGVASVGDGNSPQKQTIIQLGGQHTEVENTATDEDMKGDTESAEKPGEYAAATKATRQKMVMARGSRAPSREADHQRLEYGGLMWTDRRFCKILDSGAE